MTAVAYIYITLHIFKRVVALYSGGENSRQLALKDVQRLLRLRVDFPASAVLALRPE